MMSGKTLSRKSAFHCDLENYYLLTYGKTDCGLTRKIKLLVMSMEVHCIAVYRFGQAVKRFRKRHRVIGKAIRIIYLFMNYSMLLVHKVGLHEQSEIGAGFHINHVGNIFIGACKIGENCTVTHNVTIGRGFPSPGKSTGNRLPTIGDNVWIGTGSVLSGNITIGSDVTISAGSMLTHSIPEGCLIAGNPARVISRDYDKWRLFSKTCCKDRGTVVND